MSEESLNNEIAIVNGRIDIVEEEIASVVTAVADAEGHVLNKDNPSFWEPKLLQLREDKKQLRRKEEQLRDLVLLKEQQRRGKHVSTCFSFVCSTLLFSVVLRFDRCLEINPIS